MNSPIRYAVHYFHVHPSPLVRPSAPAPSRLSFLVAEDDDELRFIIVRLLQEEFPGARVVAYDNGRNALQDFDLNGACLVVSNHSMPEMDGPTFVRHLRQRSSLLPILMVSGSPEARQEGHAAGISCFLDKDELHSHLTATVRTLLEDSERRTALPVLFR